MVEILFDDDEDQMQFWPNPSKPDIWFDKIFTATYSSWLSRSGSDQPSIQGSSPPPPPPPSLRLSEAKSSQIGESHIRRHGKRRWYGGMEILNLVLQIQIQIQLKLYANTTNLHFPFWYLHEMKVRWAWMSGVDIAWGCLYLFLHISISLKRYLYFL